MFQAEAPVTAAGSRCGRCQRAKEQRPRVKKERAVARRGLDSHFRIWGFAQCSGKPWQTRHVERRCHLIHFPRTSCRHAETRPSEAQGGSWQAGRRPPQYSRGKVIVAHTSARAIGWHKGLEFCIYFKGRANIFLKDWVRSVERKRDSKMTHDFQRGPLESWSCR